MMNRTIFTLALIAVLIVSSIAIAQPVATGRSKALGSAATGAMFGAHAPGWNPANLGFKGNPQFSMYVPGSFAFSFGNNSFTPKYISETFVEGDTLYNDDKEEIIGKLDHNNFGLYTAVNVPVFGFSVGTFALNLDVHSYGKVELPADILKMALTGPVVETYYDLSDVNEEVMGYGSFGVSLAKPLTPPYGFSEMSLGMTFKYFYGAAYSVLDEHDGHILINYDVIDASGMFVHKHSLRGDGVGLDLAAATIYEPYKLYLGLTLGNVVGNINWTDVEAQEFSFSRLDGVSQDELNNDDYWKNFFNDADTTYDAGDISSATPMYLQLSAARNFQQDNIRLFFNYYQGLNESPAHSYTPRISLGSEFYYLKTLPLRLGLAFGGLQSTEFSTGFGLDFPGANLDFGFSWQRGLFLSAEGFSVNFSYYFGADYDPTQRVEKAKPVVPADHPGAPKPDSRIYLSMADLGLVGFDAGGENFLPEFDPFGDQSISYPDIDTEPYLDFFAESVVLVGKAKVADVIRYHLKKQTITVLDKYRLMTVSPFVPPESPLNAYALDRLVSMYKEIDSKVEYAQNLIDNAPLNFPDTEVGKHDRKVMVKEIKAMKKALLKAKKQLAAYEKFMIPNQ